MYYEHCFAFFAIELIYFRRVPLFINAEMRKGHLYHVNAA